MTARTRRFWSFLDRIMARLDSETVVSYQTVYYLIVATAGVYLWLGARVAPQPLEDTLTHGYYSAWLALNVAAPLATLYGRRCMTVGARIKPGEPNPTLFGAWMQAAGDSGVWIAVCIYVACVFNTSYWGQALYASFFVLVGVPAGLMFTVRSWRRICQINHRARRSLP